MMIHLLLFFSKCSQGADQSGASQEVEWSYLSWHLLATLAKVLFLLNNLGPGGGEQDDTSCMRTKTKPEGAN